MFDQRLVRLEHYARSDEGSCLPALAEPRAHHGGHRPRGSDDSRRGELLGRRGAIRVGDEVAKRPDVLRSRQFETAPVTATTQDMP
jgi:hypothetical protein